MDTLGKFKTNFLKDRSSFKIGFNNRSPLSQVQYSKPGSSMQHNYNIPKLSSTIGKDGTSILTPDTGELEAGFAIGEAIGKAGKNIAESMGKSIERKKFNKIVDNLPEHYSNWKKENPSKTKEDYNTEFSEHIEAFKKTHQWSQDHQGKLGFEKK
tara:strand:+ start:253 stop:717 length:465 start_codon:yes stop_codon:yes gene_type:complete